MFVGEARLPAGLAVYAVGDVHGRLDCLTEILGRIERDVERNRPDEYRVVLLGDYSDRGPDSRGVIDLLSSRSGDPHLICLLGNHDDWLMEFLDESEYVGESFLRSGGLETIASYGVEPDRARKTKRQLSRELAAAVPSSHRRFLASLMTHHIEGDYFFCHAGVRPGVELDRQQRNDLIWIREEFLDHYGSFGKVVVHGHTPADDVDFRRNRINLDTLAWNTGILSCLVLEDDRHRLIQTGTGQFDH